MRTSIEKMRLVLLLKFQEMFLPIFQQKMKVDFGCSRKCRLHKENREAKNNKNVSKTL